MQSKEVSSENITTIIKLCQNGSFEKLQDHLKYKNKTDREKIVNTLIEGSTLLINSCRHGHLDLVQYLVDDCSADIELAGSVKFDGEVIEGASPLWCAAAAGQLEVVKLLVAKGANVNKTTQTSSTPLRAACFDGHLEIVRLLVASRADIEIANRHGHTCLMISCYKGHLEIVRFLLALGADHQRQSAKGNTAMHDAAESGNLRILRLLLDRGATMRPDMFGQSPLLGAANCGHQNIVDFLVVRPELVPCDAERVNSLELLACTLIDKRRDWPNAIRRWSDALKLRAQLRLPKGASRREEAAFAGAKEFESAAELEEVAADPAAMWQQSLLVRERVLGSAHPDTAYYMRYRGAVYADQGQFERCLRLWLYALDLQHRHAKPFCPAGLASFNNFVELFAFMQSQAVPRWADVLTQVACRCVQEVAKSFAALDAADERACQYVDRLLECLVTLAALAARSDQPQSFAVLKALYDMRHLRSPLSGNCLLHFACSASRHGRVTARYPQSRLPCAAAAKQLLLLGASCDSVNAAGDTPLHLAARACCEATVRLLLDSGAHPDAVNREGATPASLLPQAEPALITARLRALLQSTKYTTLVCLAAAAVCRAGLATHDVTHLSSIIRQHSLQQ